MSKTTYKRKHSAECRFCKTVLTETTRRTLNLYHHLEIRGKLFNGLRLVSVSALSGLSQVLVWFSVVLTATLVTSVAHALWISSKLLKLVGSLMRLRFVLCMNSSTQWCYFCLGFEK